MQRLRVGNFIPLDLEIEEPLRRIRRDKGAASQLEHQPMENMEDFKEEVGSRMGDGATPDITQMGNVLRLIRDYAHLPSTTQPVIRRPTIQANNLELKSITLQLLQEVQFTRLPHEDPNAHILNFL